MKIIKNKPELRTAAEWEQWAKAKIRNKARLLTDNEINGLELGDCIEFDSADICKQEIVKAETKSPIPPNYIEKG